MEKRGNEEKVQKNVETRELWLDESLLEEVSKEEPGRDRSEDEANAEENESSHES